MTQAKPRFATFEAYLDYDDGTDNRYELIDGELVELPPESRPNYLIANFLLMKLVEAGVPLQLVYPGQGQMQVPVLRKGDAANRYPDLIVLDEIHLSIVHQFTIKLDMPPPRLVVEVLSPGKKNRDRDLINKRAQYAKRGIPEYWLIDPVNQTITVLVLESEEYIEAGVFQGSQRVTSSTFPALNLTAQEVFAL